MPNSIIMVYLAKKKIKGKIYLYLVEAARVNGKSKWIWQKYLGPEENIKNHCQDLSLSRPEVLVQQFGLPIALWQIVQKLDLINLINQFVDKRQQGLSVGHYLVLSAINRCVNPLPRENLEEWFNQTYLHHVFPPISTYLNSKAYSNHFLYLKEENFSKIQEVIQQRLQTVFHVKMDQLLYDPTNFFTYMNPQGEEALAKQGHCKEQRFLLNIVGLALVCTKDGGIPIFYDIYSGNLQDATVFQQELPEIITRAKYFTQGNKDVTVTFDKGNNSQIIFDQFDDAQIQYIASLRPSMVKDLDTLPEEEFPKYTLPNGKIVGIKEFTVRLYKKDRRVIGIYNPEQAKWNGNTLFKKLTEEIAEIKAYFRTHLNQKKWRKAEAVQKKIRDMVGRVSHLDFLKIEISGEEAHLHLNIDLEQEKLNAYVGTMAKSFLITNLPPEKSMIDITWMFRQQITVERAFSYLKSPDFCRTRPMYVSCDESIQGHIFTCVLGLLLLTLLTREVNLQLPQESLEHIQHELNNVQAVSVKYQGSAKPLLQLAQMTPAAEKLVEILHLESFL